MCKLLVISFIIKLSLRESVKRSKLVCSFKDGFIVPISNASRFFLIWLLDGALHNMDQSNRIIPNHVIMKKFKMAEASTFFNEENMKIIRNIFKEEFEKQEKNIGNLISAIFKITMEEIRKSQDEIKNLGKEICDLRSSLELTESALEEKVKKLEEGCENMEIVLQEFYNNQIVPEYVYNRW